MLGSAALSLTHPVAGSAGEGALGMAEQFDLNRLGGRAEVDRDHRLVATPRLRWIPRDDLLARPILPRIRTLASVGAARSISVRTCRMARLAQQVVSPLCANSDERSRSSRASSLVRRSAAALARSRPVARCSTAWRRNRSPPA